MGEEISLSVEETNELRRRIGLPLLPVAPSIEDDKAKSKSSAKESLSIEETNRLRMSLGLQPIPITSNNFTDDDSSETQNFQKYQSEIHSRKKDRSLLKKLEEAKLKSLSKKFTIESEESNENPENDMDSWLNRLSNKSNKPVRKVAATDKAQAARPNLAHTEQEMGELADNDILTVKDNTVVGEDEDILENDKLVDIKRTEKEAENRKRLENMKKGGKHFDLNSSDDENIEKPSNLGDASKNLARVASDLFDDILGDAPSVQAPKKKPKIKMKKIDNKNSSKSKRKSATLELDDSDLKLSAVKLDDLQGNVMEDLLEEESNLQETLKRSRVVKQRIRKQMTKEDLEKDIESLRTGDNDEDSDRETFDRPNPGNFLFDHNEGLLGVLDQKLLSAKPEVALETDEAEKNNNIHGNDSEAPQENLEPKKADEEEKISFNSGLSSTLNFLRSRNILNDSSASTSDNARVKQEMSKEAELLKLKISIEERLVREELESNKGFMNKPRDERENLIKSLLEQRLAEKNIVSQDKRAADNKISANYNPSVKLSYRDEMGNILSQKEAYKQLSHKFHGVNPGKANIDKKLKRMAARSKEGSHFDDRIL
ncbi:Piso0_000910 [Millerozyma farinosa CBS 7064]|uniref:Piso0_000910 protein n=1 Tax=Pichia sorbitophila (strain ATCC MYA-4447 / BCRC 22081 / CBS 7064 / NBRC 10061 / NRRL Y-12695) TaxID=559304 RepID=G8YQE1_PICSO|nr:Piso0_000910 [Millerozyma farinosa CBS 7064]